MNKTQSDLRSAFVFCLTGIYLITTSCPVRALS